MDNNRLEQLLNELIKTSRENEWLEFKENFHNEEEIGKNISALSNGACLADKSNGYLVFGVTDEQRKIVGTTFDAKNHKKGNEDLENWLVNLLNPRIDFSIHQFTYRNNLPIVLFKIPATKDRPVNFQNQSYVRVNNATRPLNQFSAKEAKIWNKKSVPFEKDIAKDELIASDIIDLLSIETYFDLIKLPQPQTQETIINKLIEEGLVIKNEINYAITKLGAILFAKNLSQFEGLERKAVRVIMYEGKNKVNTTRERTGIKGYAVELGNLLDWIDGQLPANEEIGRVLRTEKKMYPEIAIRELIINALIHQDFSVQGFPMIEIFSNRIEISNAGEPLIEVERFIDGYLSRNDKLADLMRRMNFCEEKGSGWDKIIFNNELYQLPPINTEVANQRTKTTIFSYKTLNDLDKREKIRACYQHACLKYVSSEKMTNQSLRKRFKIQDQNAAIASRIIKDTLIAKLIKDDNPENTSRKYTSYSPFWV